MKSIKESKEKKGREKMSYDIRSLSIGMVAIGLLLIVGAILIGITQQEGGNPLRTLNATKNASEGNNRFAFDFYKKIVEKETSKNVFFSPLSITMVFAMLSHGTGNETEEGKLVGEELEEVFGFGGGKETTEQFAALASLFRTPSAPYELHLANGLWVQKGYGIKKEFLEYVRSYRGEVKELDFRDRSGAAKEINDFANKHTRGKIRKVVDENAVSEDTRLVIANAIYFKGEWVKEFDASLTKREDFTLIDGSKKKTPLMSMFKTKFMYGENDDAQIIELPYKGENMVMVIILPKQSLPYFEKKFTYEKFVALRKTMEEKVVDELYIPTFEMDTSYNLIPYLKSLGMKQIFRGGQNFPRINDDDLFVGLATQKAYIKTDEKGTEAAAVTVGGVMRTSIGGGTREYIVFRADKPFIFLIMEKRTGTILFMGRMVEPTAS